MRVYMFAAPHAVVIHAYLHRWQHYIRYWAISRINTTCFDFYRNMFQIMVENDFSLSVAARKKIDFKIMRLKVQTNCNPQNFNEFFS